MVVCEYLYLYSCLKYTGLCLLIHDVYTLHKCPNVLLSMCALVDDHGLFRYCFHIH